MRSKALAAEFLGTALLAFVVVGSGATIQRLGSDDAGGLFYHAIVVGLALAGLIALMAATSGAHFNPAVTMAFWRRRALDGRSAIGYVLAQGVGAIAGLTIAVISFGRGLALTSTERATWGPLLAETVGTLVLVLLILALRDQGRSPWIPAAVGAWVAAAVFSTVSTGFLNPALTVARMFTDTYTGIGPSRVPGFVAAQLLGAAVAVVLSARLLLPATQKGT